MRVGGPSIGGPSIGKSTTDKIKDLLTSALDDMADSELELAQKSRRKSGSIGEKISMTGDDKTSESSTDMKSAMNSSRNSPLSLS